MERSVLFPIQNETIWSIAMHSMRPLHAECWAEAMGIPAEGSDVSKEFNLGFDPARKHC